MSQLTIQEDAYDTGDQAQVFRRARGFFQTVVAARKIAQDKHYAASQPFAQVSLCRLTHENGTFRRCAIPAVN